MNKFVNERIMQNEFPTERIRKSKAAQRRHHYRRLKIKRATYWGYGQEAVLGCATNQDDNDMTPKQLGLVVATPHPCSRACCGNPRKYFNEETIQEQRNNQDEN